MQYISLLRGINVGGHRKIKMADLKGVYESLELAEVVVLLQTGNVLFKSDETDSESLSRKIEAACEQQFGFHTNIILLTSPDLQAIAEGSPFSLSDGKDPKWMVIHFLSGMPDDAAIGALLKYEGPEEMLVKGSALYVYYTEGAGRSKLTNALIEKRLNVRATARNWNTCTKLLALVK